MGNIEQIKTEIDEIQNEFKKLAENIHLSEEEKQKTVETLNTRCQKIKEEIEQEIASLGEKTDAEAQEKREKAEMLLESIKNIVSLDQSVKISAGSASSETQTDEGKVGFFTKVIKWISGAGTTLFSFFSKIFKKKQTNTSSGTGKIGSFPSPKPPLKPDDNEGKEIKISYPETISEGMFQNLLTMEGPQPSGTPGVLVAKAHTVSFGESFATGPYGMVYKRIDSDEKPLKQAIPFKDGETVEEEWAKVNAKAYYDRRAKEWSKWLKERNFQYTQHQLDALVSASGGTTDSKNRLQTYVLDNWNTPEKISEYLLDFATTAKGDGQIKKGLVIRRQFESQWFKGESRSFTDCQKDYFGWNRKVA